ncbi:DUF4126 domain-containing protein [Euryarchaeota archaeon]|jgi:hypothetical protein|nr:DUF4126 domain-containing protein [Candidatus Thalassarchaeum sp.]MDA7556062.1 DUF4126 domain-containing protein [Euryarchaeota archaeon]MDB3855598.1 DUF4126 domain-containing protein [Euryarchaeota archaeon]MDB4865081.1 DUF4126 domain-containing protein [Euryarchaeota archaeon]MDC0852482.1 DUF4126 domain-containing protein [Euryarchaeota archaeon]
MSTEATILAALMGLSLASASGFRVFLPPFLLSIAVRTDTLVNLDLSDTSFAIFDSNAAVLILGIACLAEFAAYYVPWLDNLLDTIATPAAVLSGVGMSSMVLVGTDPIMQWSFAIIAGGGSAGIIQLTTVAIRGLSSTLTLGFGNSFVASGENIASVVLTIAALLAPLIAAIFAIIIILLLVRQVTKKPKESSI